SSCGYIDSAKLENKRLFTMHSVRASPGAKWHVVEGSGALLSVGRYQAPGGGRSIAQSTRPGAKARARLRPARPTRLAKTSRADGEEPYERRHRRRAGVSLVLLTADEGDDGRQGTDAIARSDRCRGVRVDFENPDPAGVFLGQLLDDRVERAART